LIEKNGIPFSAFFQGDKGSGGYFGKLADKRIESLGSDSYAAKTITEDKWSAGKASPDDIRKIDRIKDELATIICRLGRNGICIRKKIFISEITH